MGFFQPSGIRNRRGFFGEAAAAPFSPASISGLKLWLKADAGVTLSGSNVTGWADQSGNSNHAVGVSNPVFQSSQINSLPAIFFNGLAFFSIPNFLDGSAATLFVLVKPTGGAGDDSGALLGNFGNSIVGTHYPYQGDLIYDSFACTERKNDISQPAGFFDYHIYCVLSKNGEWTYRFNGATHFTTDENTYNASTLNGQGPFIGRQTGLGVFRFLGFIAEIICYTRDLSSSEISSVNSYLATRYAIS
jgi:hypothetical protein